MTSSSRSARQLATLERLRSLRKSQSGAALFKRAAEQMQAQAGLRQAESVYARALESQRKNRDGRRAIDPALYGALLEASGRASDRLRVQEQKAARADSEHRRALDDFAQKNVQLKVVANAYEELRHFRRRCRDEIDSRDSHDQYSRRGSALEDA